MINTYVLFPLILATLGFVFSSGWWLKMFNRLVPPLGLTARYVAIFVVILLMKRMGLAATTAESKDLLYALGVFLVVFAFFLVFGGQSLYTAQVLQPKSPSPAVEQEEEEALEIEEARVLNMYLNSEDGAIYYLFYNLAGLKQQPSRILTYVITPVILAIVGLVLIQGHPIELSVL